MKTNVYEKMINSLRYWLRGGATIRAADPYGKILEVNKDGTWFSGLTIKFPKKKK